MYKIRKNKGITLISLVITIIVLVILASVATYSGVSTIQSSKFTKFETELRIMQTQVNSLYEKDKNATLGKEIDTNNTQASKVFTANESGITDKTGYMYFDKETIKAKAGVPDLKTVVDLPPCIKGSNVIFFFLIRQPMPFIP